MVDELRERAMRLYKGHCSEVTRTWQPRFNGSIFVGGGSQTCSRKATMVSEVWYSKELRPFCTFHGNRCRAALATISKEKLATAVTVE